MWSGVLSVGIVLVGLGALKRKTSWGTGIALAGAAGIAVALLVAGPEITDAAQQACQEGWAAERAWPDQYGAGLPARREAVWALSF